MILFRSPHAFDVAENGAKPVQGGHSASAAFQRLGSRAIKTATAKNNIFAIAVNRGHDVGFVGVDLERGALWDGFARIRSFFVMTWQRKRPQREWRIS